MADAQRDTQEYWTQYIEEFNEQFYESLERSAEAQMSLADAWLNSVDETTDEEYVRGMYEGWLGAYEAWMDATQELFNRTVDAVEGEEIPVEEFRDIWLNASNQSFKEMMRTTTFARTTGQAVGDTLDVVQRANQTAESTLHSLGFATESDVMEVGERLVELERRQQRVEEKLDRLIAAVET
ncbi:MAG: poly(R)-hydroxyalkanoic acid synthase subunit PhaE [Halobacteriota archaeon]